MGRAPSIAAGPGPVRFGPYEDPPVDAAPLGCFEVWNTGVMWGVTALCLLLLQPIDHLADGLKALEEGKYEAAVQSLNKAVESDPKDYGAQFHLGLALTMLGRDAEAAARYKMVLDLKPGLYEAELNLGIVLLRQKQAAESVPYLAAAAEEKPKEYRPAFYLAEALFAAGEFAKAEEKYLAASELDPKSAAAQLGLGQSRARQNRLAEASQNYRKAAELDAGLRSYLLELATLHEKQGQPAEAIAIYSQFPDNAGARERLGELLLESGKPAEAIPHLEWAVNNSPTPANRLALATALLRGGQAEKALPVLEQAVASEPANLDLRMMHGRVLRDQRKFAEAAREFFQVAQAKPDSVEAWNELAGMLILLEHYPQALAALDRLKALGHETAAHFFFRGMIYDKTAQLKPAMESYERFLAMSEGKSPDEEFKARQRVRIIKKELSRK